MLTLSCGAAAARPHPVLRGGHRSNPARRFGNLLAVTDRLLLQAHRHGAAEVEEAAHVASQQMQRLADIEVGVLHMIVDSLLSVVHIYTASLPHETDHPRLQSSLRKIILYRHWIIVLCRLLAGRPNMAPSHNVQQKHHTRHLPWEGQHAAMRTTIALRRVGGAST